MKVHELYTDASRWTKGTPARDAEGCPTGHNNPKAVCWCVAGAISHCYSNEDSKASAALAAYVKLWNHLIKQSRFFKSVAAFNDAPETTFEDVKKLVTELDV